MIYEGKGTEYGQLKTLGHEGIPLQISRSPVIQSLPNPWNMESTTHRCLAVSRLDRSFKPKLSISDLHDFHISSTFTSHSKAQDSSLSIIDAIYLRYVHQHIVRRRARRLNAQCPEAKTIFEPLPSTESGKANLVSIRTPGWV